MARKSTSALPIAIVLVRKTDFDISFNQKITFVQFGHVLVMFQMTTLSFHAVSVRQTVGKAFHPLVFFWGGVQYRYRYAVGQYGKRGMDGFGPETQTFFVQKMVCNSKRYLRLQSSVIKTHEL